MSLPALLLLTRTVGHKSKNKEGSRPPCLCSGTHFPAFICTFLTFGCTCLTVRVLVLRAFSGTSIADRRAKFADLLRELTVTSHKGLCHFADIRAITTEFNTLSRLRHIHAATIGSALFASFVAPMARFDTGLKFTRGGHCHSHDNITPSRNHYIMANMPTKSTSILLMSPQIVLHPFKGIPINFALCITFS